MTPGATCTTCLLNNEGDCQGIGVGADPQEIKRRGRVNSATLGKQDKISAVFCMNFPIFFALLKREWIEVRPQCAGYVKIFFILAGVRPRKWTCHGGPRIVCTCGAGKWFE